MLEHKYGVKDGIKRGTALWGKTWDKRWNVVCVKSWGNLWGTKIMGQNMGCLKTWGKTWDNPPIWVQKYVYESQCPP